MSIRRKLTEYHRPNSKAEAASVGKSVPLDIFESVSFVTSFRARKARPGGRLWLVYAGQAGWSGLRWVRLIMLVCWFTLVAPVDAGLSGFDTFIG